MKKTILTIALVLILVVAALFTYFPAQQPFEYSLKLALPAKALQRSLQEQSLHPVAKAAGPQEVVLRPGFYDGFLLSIATTDSQSQNSPLKLIPLGTDSTIVYLNGVVRGGNDPLARIATWKRTQVVKEKAKAWLQNLQQMEQPEQLYGFKVNVGQVPDSVMVTKRFTSPAYPTTKQIYGQVALLQQYVTSAGAQATNPPMLFVQETCSGYEAQVALPTNRLLPGKADISYRRMVVKGNILWAELRGGQATVEEGIRQLGNYVLDHGHISPAIPFASLVTDRTREADTTRWVTRIYYPIY
ncbi:hypothetical protein SAMN05444008_11850 [Cnuella takakiae]|uniref:Effector-binding domain-containing protein n=1 Tax=Cnuella takakiae TaxID=1302690 RepID=A0A1M5H6G4_9BACT|nr:hypothetical protein [Cnuella takakiae]OLY91095.1 hypothetical protein BUE76_03650 [Cnuella takakiae]SHG11505.1 hypothetical protein SAMN05444008_11850 [Cnuella takakiae]